MNSAARLHFPRFIIEPSQKWLFNPILKKRFKNRPEERVRLKWVEFLLHQTDWKKSRIAFEAPVSLPQISNSLRADLLLYDDSLKPHILVECKTESIPLNEKTAEQAARYNTLLDAPYLILTNGVTDACFRVDGSQPEQVENPIKKASDRFNKSEEYWAERGFYSSTSSEKLKKWLHEMLDSFWNQQGMNTARYLGFNETFLPFPMDHYYRIFEPGPDQKLAVSFLGEQQSGSYLTAILNKKGQNSGILTIHLDKWYSGEKAPAKIITPKQEKTVNAGVHFKAGGFSSQKDFIKILPGQLMKFFD